MSCAITIPDNMFSPTSGGNRAVPPLNQDVIREVENQLQRKIIEKCGGKLNLADGVALYANNADGIGQVQSIKTNKDGSSNKNRNNFGNIYEGMEVFSTNRQGIVQGDGRKAVRTDDLSEQKKSGKLEHDSLNKHANLYDQHTDIVVYDGKSGTVLQTQQAKHVRNSTILLEEKYTTSPDAPSEIIVPKDSYEKHKAQLERISKTSRDPEKRVRAKVALEKLRPGNVDSIWSSRPDRDSHPILANIVDKAGGGDGIVGTSIPYVYIVGQAAGDAAERVGKRAGVAILEEIAVMTIGGAIWELRDAYNNPESIDIESRIKRFFLSIINKMKESSVFKCGREVALEVVTVLLGLLSNACSSISSLLNTIGKGIKQVFNSIYEYVTGQIKSFSELVSIILKSIATIGIGSLAVLLERKLELLGLPSLISGLISAAIAGIAIIFASRGIDALIFSVTSAFSQAKAAALRREKIEEYCNEIIPKLIGDRMSFDAIVNRYYKERKAILSDAFSSMKNALITKDAVVIYRALESINAMFGNTLGWSCQEEIDALMLSDDCIRI